MISEEEVKKQMDLAEAKFNQIRGIIEATVAEYNQKMAALQEEGQNKVRDLEAQLETARGEYTANFRLLHPEQFKDEQPVQTEENTVNVETADVKVEEITEEQPVETQNDSTLTEEEIQKVKEAVEPVKETKKAKKEPKQEDVPDYLAEEYNK